MDTSAEGRIAMLEAVVSAMADMLYVSHARGLALQHLLAERGLLDFEQVAARMTAMQDSADAEVELSAKYRAVMEWRRTQEGTGAPPPDDGT